MKCRTIIGLLVVLMICSCSRRTSKGRLLIDSGLKIDNGPSHGASYTGSLGTKYSLRYIPITITNDSTILINIQIDWKIINLRIVVKP